MENLRIPGPTPLPGQVLQAISKQMINHRGPEFRQMLADVTQKLKLLFQTRNDLLLLTSSGTGGMEAAVVNTLSPGDKVLAVSVGVFGDRFASIAKQYGADVTIVRSEHGKAADTDAVKKALQNDPQVKAVLVTHNETSTGITNDLASISSLAKEYDKLLLVDAISSLGCIELPVDDWHVDVAVTGSQKGFMVPPGLAMISVSEAAWRANAKARMPRFYFDLAKAKGSLEKGETPWTPAVSVVFGLATSLDMMVTEGFINIVARHARVAAAAREGVKSLGLSLLADERHASNTVTAVVASNGLDPKQSNKILREEYGIVLAGGQGSLEGKIFRIGHLGWVSEDDIKAVISALQQVLPRAGFKGIRA